MKLKETECPVDLKSILLPCKEMTAELEIFLSTYFTRSKIEKNKMVYGNELVVEYYSKNNENHNPTEIKSIYPANDNKSSLLNNIEKKAQEALSTNNGSEVGRAVLFSPYEINGNYRFDNNFQIIIPPANAPKQKDQPWADHPFVLEFVYPKSTHNQINMHRKSKRHEVLSLVLNVFMKGGVKSIRNNAQREWVIVPEKSDNTSRETRHLQHGYILPDDKEIEKDKYGFTVFNQEDSLNETEPNDYYADFAITLGEALSLPININALVSKFNSLCNNERENFLRASYWERVGADSFYISQSNAYIALVNAIESLIPQEKTESLCELCQKEIKKGLTQLFHDFLESHVPELKPSYRKELYAIRSKYTHGKNLMPGDMGNFGFRFNPSNNNDFSNYRTLAQVVRIAILNWIGKRNNHEKIS